MELQFGFINTLNGMEFAPPESKKDPELYKQMRNIKVYNEKDEELKIDTGVKLISTAITNLNEKGFTSNSLYDPLWYVHSILKSKSNLNSHKYRQGGHAPSGERRL